MDQQHSDDTNGVPVSVLDCNTSVTVVVENKTDAELNRQRLRELRGEERHAA
jgi:hypothetical protein